MKVSRLDGSNVYGFEEVVRDQLARRRSGARGYYAHPGLDDFHWDRLVVACNSESATVWACQDNDGPVLIFGLSKHPFHTRIFRTSVGRVYPLYLIREQVTVGLAALRHVYSRAKELRLNLLSLRIPTTKHLLSYCLSARGWRHVGTSVKLGIDRQKWADCCVDSGIARNYIATSDEQQAVSVRQAIETDLPSLSSLISRAHRHSHLFNDPRLPADGRRAVFPAWVERSIRGGADRILVATSEDKILGFTSCFISRGLRGFIGHEVGVVDFVAVDPEAQGQGIGSSLLRAALAWLFERVPFVELRTMVDNISALLLYIKVGLSPVASDHHYHGWLLPARVAGRDS